jgi:hypothetical protein
VRTVEKLDTIQSSQAKGSEHCKYLKWTEGMSSWHICSSLLFPCSQCMICGSFTRTWRWWQAYMLINKQIHPQELLWVEGRFVASWTHVCYMWEDDWWTYDVIGSVQQDGVAVAGCDLLDSHDGIGMCEIVFVP